MDFWRLLLGDLLLLGLGLLGVDRFLGSGLISFLIFLVIFLILLTLLEERQDVEVLFFEEYLLFLEALGCDFSLFFDGFGASVDFLQYHLHHGGLEFGQQLHLLERLLGLLVRDLTGLFSKVPHGAIILVIVLELL